MRYTLVYGRKNVMPIGMVDKWTHFSFFLYFVSKNEMSF